MQHLKVSKIAAAVATAVRLHHVGLGSLALIAGVGLSGVALADQLPAAAGADVTDAKPADSAPIDTVVVTARKKLERAQDVPVAITTVSADSLIQQNRVGLKDFYTAVPGLNYSAGDRGTSEVSLRGITSGPSANTTTAITIDDAPFGSSQSSVGGGTMMPDIDPADLQRIEVLRGPQGTLYGASSLGGLVKYVTVQPNTMKYSGRVQVDGSKATGGGNGYGMRASLNVPVREDMLGVRVSVYDRQDPGFIDDTRQGHSNVDASKTKGGRISAVLTPSSTLTVRASAMFQQSSAGASSSTDTDKTGHSLYGEYSHRRIPGTDGYDRNLSFMDLAVTDDLGWGTFTSVTSRGRVDYNSDQDATATLGAVMNAIGATGAGVISANAIHTTKFTQEFRLDSPEDKRALDWRAGLFYTREDGHLFQRLSGANQATGALIASIPVVGQTDTTSRYEDFSGFGTLTYHFTDRFDVQAGGRLSHSRQDYRNDALGLIIGPETIASNSSSDRASTYTLTPRMMFSKDLMAYATLSTGYRPGGPNAGLSKSAPRTYKSDTTQNLELGLKGDLFDRKLSFSAALYKIDWKDIQLLAVDTNGLTFLQNGAEAQSTGIETSMVWAPRAGLKVSGNAVYNDAHLTSSLPAGSTNAGKSGDRLPFSSRTTGSLSVSQDFAMNAGLKGFVGGGAVFTGSRVGSFMAAGAQRVDLAGFTTFDLQAGVKAKDWNVSLFVKNATDKYAYLGGVTRGAMNQYTVMAPRTVGFSLSHSL